MTQQKKGLPPSNERENNAEDNRLPPFPGSMATADAPAPRVGLNHGRESTLGRLMIVRDVSDATVPLDFARPKSVGLTVPGVIQAFLSRAWPYVLPRTEETAHGEDKGHCR